MSARESLHLTDTQLDDYVDGTLSDAERATAEEHLAACERCRRAVGHTHEVIAIAQRQRVPVAAPAELWPLVAASTIHVAAVRRQVLASMRGLLIAGAIAIAAATAVITWRVARWTAGPNAVAPSTVTPRSGAPGPAHAGHAGHAEHPVVPAPPIPPKAPVAPRP
jgi:predicted anti-sigma-YlaC factor YlaD